MANDMDAIRARLRLAHPFKRGREGTCREIVCGSDGPLECSLPPESH